jgi:hypothetical protein
MLNEKANLNERIPERNPRFKSRFICQSAAGEWVPGGRGEMQQIESKQPHGRGQGSVFAG